MIPHFAAAALLLARYLEVMKSQNLKWINLLSFTAYYDEIKQKVITQANDYHRVKAYTP